jgi:hypothetical protein
LNYDTYAEGEALLGWLNGTFRLRAASPFDGNLLLLDIARELRDRLAPEQPEIAHFKMTLMPDDAVGDIAVLNLVGSDRDAELSHTLEEHMVSGELIVNLRAEGDPELLRAAVLGTLAAAAARRNARSESVHIEHFRPSRPTPTYHMATVDS